MSAKKESMSDQQLHLASLQGDLDKLRRILDSGKVHVDCKDRDGTTPLILAAANDHLECVRELLSEGADPNERRNTGTTALFFAAQGGFLDIVKELIEHDSDVDTPSQVIHERDVHGDAVQMMIMAMAKMDGGTPLFVACQCNHLEVVQELVARGANIHQTMNDGATCLFIAAQNGHYNMLKYLIAQGAKVDQTRNDKASALWIAAQMGHSDIIRELLQAGANVDLAREDGATPLFKASHKGYIDCVTDLLAKGASLGLLKNGETALHAAALFGHLKVVKQLIDAGCDVSLKNKDNITAAEMAKDAGFDVIAEFLTKTAGAK